MSFAATAISHHNKENKNHNGNKNKKNTSNSKNYRRQQPTNNNEIGDTATSASNARLHPSHLSCAGTNKALTRHKDDLWKENIQNEYITPATFLFFTSPYVIWYVRNYGGWLFARAIVNNSVEKSNAACMRIRVNDTQNVRAKWNVPFSRANNNLWSTAPANTRAIVRTCSAGECVCDWMCLCHEHIESESHRNGTEIGKKRMGRLGGTGISISRYFLAKNPRELIVKIRRWRRKMLTKKIWSEYNEFKSENWRVQDNYSGVGFEQNRSKAVPVEKKKNESG